MDRVDVTEEVERPGRPWAEGVGLVLLGLGVSAVANVLAMTAATGAAVRALGVLGYLAGVGIVGTGVHRVLWARSPRTGRARFVVTALVTLPVFAATALVLSFLLTIVQLRMPG
jgi:drug/metabolite transporter (DMT)-like permease